MQLVALGFRRAQPFARRDPDRMARRVIIAKACDGFAEKLHLAGRCIQRIFFRISREFGELGVFITARGGGGLPPALRPKRIEIWRFLAHARAMAAPAFE